MSKHIKHTPGPWIYKDGSVFADRHDGEVIALPHSRPGQCAAAQEHDWDKYGILADEEGANGRMMAAAPDLYNGVNALLGLVQIIAGRDDVPSDIRRIFESGNHRIEEARAAILKAVKE